MGLTEGWLVLSPPPPPRPFLYVCDRQREWLAWGRQASILILLQFQLGSTRPLTRTPAQTAKKKKTHTALHNDVLLSVTIIQFSVIVQSACDTTSVTRPACMSLHWGKVENEDKGFWCNENDLFPYAPPSLSILSAWAAAAASITQRKERPGRLIGC